MTYTNKAISRENAVLLAHKKTGLNKARSYSSMQKLREEFCENDILKLIKLKTNDFTKTI